jgi:LPS-assembly lipoprotein
MKKHLLTLSAFVLLSGCGFHAIYGDHTTSDGAPVAADLNNIAIDNISDRDGQLLRNDLIDRMYGLNRPSQPLYHLSVKIRFDIQDLGILANATATRSILNMYGDYTLTDAKGKILVTGTTHSVANIEKLDQIYGTVVSEDEAKERTLHEVSEQIVNRISLYFSERQ